MDLEAENWTEVKLVGFYDKSVSVFRQFPDVPTFLDFFFQGWAGIPCYIHFLSYDGQFILQELMKRKIAFNVIERNRIIAIKIHYEGKSYEFRDSYSLFFSGLKNLTHDFAVEHQKLEARDFANQFLNPTYNEYDCKGLYEVLEKFFVIVEGDVGLTLAATAMKFFRRRYLHADIYRNRTLEPQQRKAYYGARNEILNFNLDMDKRFYHYDINSLYPYSMRAIDYPIGQLRFGRGDIESEGFSYAVVQENDELPVLPTRQGKLYFMNGRKEGYWTNIELRYAREVGAKVDVRHSYTTQHSAPLFREFVDDLYERRLKARNEGNGALAYTTKILMNSLYGKFGQSQEVRRIFYSQIDDDLVGAVPLNDSETAFSRVERKEFAHAIPLLAAYVTAYARTELHRRLKEVEFESVYYTDTDSVVCDKKAFENDSQLGRFKLEDQSHDFLLFLPKLYFYRSEKGETKLRNKGVTVKEGEQEFDFDERLRNAVDFIATNRFELRRGIRPLITALKKQKGEQLVERKTMIKTFRSDYDKRRIVGGDWGTQPFEDQPGTNGNYAELKKLLTTRFNKSYAQAGGNVKFALHRA